MDNSLSTFFGFLVFAIIMLMDIQTVIIWCDGQTLGKGWECTKWSMHGQKDHQSSICDQFSRKTVSNDHQ